MKSTRLRVSAVIAIEAMAASAPPDSIVLTMVSQRRGLLDYMKSKDAKRYEAIISKLGLRR